MENSLRQNDDERILKPARQTPHIGGMQRKARTDHFISKMMTALAGEASYEAAMNGMLEMMSSILKPERLSIFELRGHVTVNTFELCAEGIEPQIGTVHPLHSLVLKKWFGQRDVALVPDVSVVENFSKPLYDWFIKTGVQRFMAAPFFSNGEIVGFLGAYNYNVDEDFDVRRLFAAVSSFVGARIENRRLVDDLDWAVRHDPLTKLLNRRGYESAVSAFMAENPNTPYTLALIDLDDFKKVNDLYGHLAGDEALRSIGKKIIDVFPESAFLSRNGGDEFIAMLPGITGDDADKLIKQFVDDGIIYEYDGKQHRLTVSVGYAFFPEHADDYESICAKADTALYAVKLAEKSSARKYSPELEYQYRTRLGFSPHDIAKHITCAIAIHSADKSGEMLFVNDELLHLTECDNATELLDLIGGVFWNVMHPDDREHVREALMRRAEDEDYAATTSADFYIVTKTGAKKRVLGSARLVKIDDVGKVFYTTAIEHN